MAKKSYTTETIENVRGMLEKIMPSGKVISLADVVKKNEKQIRGAITRGVTLPEIVKKMDELGVKTTLSTLRAHLRTPKPKKAKTANEWN